MKLKLTIRPVILTIFILVPVLNLFAETGEKNASPPKFGIGIAFHDLYETLMLNGEAPLLYFPIDFDTWRLEPSIAYSKTKDSDDIGNEDIQTMTTLGIGGFFKNNFDKTTIYYGAKFGKREITISYSYASDPQYDREGKYSTTFLEPTIGGDYFLSPHFSIGGQMSFRRAITTLDSNINYSGSSTEITDYNTKVIILLRFFF